VRVFVRAGDAGGNELGVFLAGSAIPRERRLVVTAELGFSDAAAVQPGPDGTLDVGGAWSGREESNRHHRP
jgi:hypothetical protein